MPNLSSLLAAQFPQLDVKYDYALAQQTYFKIGGPAEAFVTVTDLATLQALLTFCHQHHIKTTIMGGASNVVVADKGIAGVVIFPKNTSIELIPATKVPTSIISATPTIGNSNDFRFLEAGAGVKTALLVGRSVELGLTGLEYFLGVPGSLGGAVYNNAHYLQQLIGTHIHSVQAVTQSGQLVTYSQLECEFAYDDSRFKHHPEVIWSVVFALKAGDKAQSQELIKQATHYRANSQPLGEPSSGCIFQNVPNTDHLRQVFPQFAERTHVPGGFLIDQAGLKGEKEGDVEVSHKHAAFFVNKGHGSAAQVQKLIAKVKQRVFDAYGVQLQEEVVYLS